jgi:hypothetical protein
MTDQISPPAWQPDTSNPKAAAKAAKAYAKASRPFYKKKRFILPVAMVVLIVIIAASSGGSGDNGPKVIDDKNTSANDKSNVKDEPKVDAKADPGTESNPVRIGKTVELEGTQYTVKSARKASSLGGEFMEEKADGVFVVVTLTIENMKDESKIFSDSAAKFVTSDGTSYGSDSDGTIAVMGDGGEPLFFEEMHPDLPKTGQLIFDVPPKALKGGMLEVSDLFGGGEAYIALGLK